MNGKLVVMQRSRVSRTSIFMVVGVVAEVMSVFHGQLSGDSRSGSWQADHPIFEGLVTTVQMEAHQAYT